MILGAGAVGFFDIKGPAQPRRDRIGIGHCLGILVEKRLIPAQAIILKGEQPHDQVRQDQEGGREIRFADDR